MLTLTDVAEQIEQDEHLKDYAYWCEHAVWWMQLAEDEDRLAIYWQRQQAPDLARHSCRLTHTAWTQARQCMANAEHAL